MSRIYYKQALYIKKSLKHLILLTFLIPDALKRLFLRHEAPCEPPFHNIYSYFSTLLQPEIRLPCRFSPVSGH